MFSIHAASSKTLDCIVPSGRIRGAVIRLSCFLAAAAIGMVSMPAAQAVVYSWNGVSGTWNTAANWSPSSGTPGAYDDIVFNTTAANAASSTITLGSANRIIRSGTFTTSGSTTLLAGGTARTLTIMNPAGIVMSAASGPVTLGNGVAGNDVLVTIRESQVWTNNSASNFTINNTTATFTRNSNAFLTFRTGSTGAFVMSSTVAPNTNGILGPWAFFGSGTGTRYATNSSGTIAGLVGTTAANATALTDTTGTVNYDLASGTGTIGAANFAGNTIRYTGSASTLTPGASSFSINGLVNSGTGVLTVATNPITIGSTRQLVINAASNGVTISSRIADNAGGASALVVGGPGNSTTLSGSNSFTGGITVLSGNLVLNNNNAAGTGTILGSGSGEIRVNPGITVANPVQIDANVTNFTAIRGVSGGNSALTGGITLVGSEGGGPIILADGTLTLSGTISGAGSNMRPSLRGSGTGVINGVVNLPLGGLDFNSSATWTLNTAGSTMTQFSVNGGVAPRIILAANNAIPTNIFFNPNGTSTGSLRLNGFNQGFAGLGSGTAFTITNNSASADSTLTLSGLTADQAYAGVITDGTGGRKISLVMSSTGGRTQTLSGTSTYTGSTTINVGTLRAGAAAGGQAFGNLSAVTLSSTSGATLDLNGFNQTIGSLAGGGTAGGNVALGAGTLTTGGNNTSTSYAGVIGGSGGLVKAGSGIFTLSGSNTFSGATTVSAGQLQIGSAGAVNSTSGITVNGLGAELKFNAATALSRPLTLTQGVLSGTGTIGTAVTVASNAVLSPGNSPGSQSFTQGLTFGQGGQYTWEINNWPGAAGTDYDQLVVSGSGLNVAATSGSTFKIAITGQTSGNASGAVPGFSAASGTGTSFTIATSAAGITGFDTTKFTVDTSGFTNNNPLPTSAGFWLSQSGTNLLLNYAPSATRSLSAAASAAQIIVGGTATISASVINAGNPANSPDALSFTGLAVGNGVTLGSTSGAGITAGGTSTTSGAFTTVTAGTYTFSPSVTAATNTNIGTNAIVGSASSATLTVLDHATSSLSGAGTVLSTVLDLGTWDYGSQTWTSGTNTVTFTISNLASLAGADLTAALSLTGYTPNENGFATNLNTYVDILGGQSSPFTVSVDPTSFFTSGTQSKTFTISMADKTGLSGGTSTNTLTVTANVVVVPEPGTLALAGMAVVGAGWMLSRRRAVR